MFSNIRLSPVLIVAASGLIGMEAAQAATPVFINEIHYDNSGTDIGEAIEIVGPAGTDLHGWRLVLYNGNGGAAYDTRLLTGGIADQSGNGYGTLSVSYPSNGIQNGAPDGVALIDADNRVVQFLSYEGSFIASDGPAAGISASDIGVAESSGTASGLSLQLSGSGSHYEDFVWQSEQAASFGAINSGQQFGDIGGGGSGSLCGQAAVSIGDIQGSGGYSPLAGSVQHVEALVTAGFQGTAQLGGFFVQQAGNPVNSAQSQGLFVQSGFPVEAGDLVHLVGTVAETFGMTRLQNLSAAEVCSHANALPEPVPLSLPFDGADNDPERREGMLITLPQTLTVTENYDLARYGEFVLSAGGRLITPTQIAAPGEAAADLAAQNALNRLTVDDGSNDQNPEPVVYPQPDGLSAANSLRSGDTVSGATGILAYDFGEFRLQPTEALVSLAQNARTAKPERNGRGSLTVASFNVLNFFNGDGQGGGFPTARGADSAAELARQKAKIVAALNALDADVVGLMELENDGYSASSAIAELVAGLNQAAGRDKYRFIDPGLSRIGSDEITVGLIYRADKVSVSGPAVVLDSRVDPDFLDAKNRPALAQTFLDRASNKSVTVSVNHFKSKGSACDDVNDPDTGDGQGNCNLTRLAAAGALARWLANDPTGMSAANVLIVGDLNAYAQEDPITELKRAGYHNLLEENPGNRPAYSYVFDAASGYLDHVLANPQLRGQIQDLGEWHINADEPRALDYNSEFKSAGQIDAFYAADPYRSSDHDPLFVAMFVPGDLDNDGDADFDDALAMRKQIGQCVGRPGLGYNPEADYDASGCVSYADYRVWYGHYARYQANAGRTD
ncbi:ExeM/NucH family extracellular endonuclease [Methylomonas rhizoryzae]|uniref:ExeM/NucH family extracellular endonuclease n=1 Tax=Methylomonas rhizoryzae TaxID=2608981 RepID=UPI001231BEFA|nr:ExeM/NucH family extracellular endonuclease [Methylomonas rhizoryzae]